MDINVLGIDIAKRVFQLHGVNKSGKRVYQKRLYRESLVETVLNIGAKQIVMEACGTSHYWGRKFQDHGFEVKLIAPQFVKPFVKTNKTDKADAAAICEAAQRPSMRFVDLKSKEQQSIQFLHRERERLIKNRTSLCNEARSMLLEYGISTRRGVSSMKKQLLSILQAESQDLPWQSQKMFIRFNTELHAIEGHIAEVEKELKTFHDSNEVSQRLTTVFGVGIINATAMVGSVANPKSFKNGRAFSAWLGLVPRQHSSGEKFNLLGISKRGDSYLRKQLIHGARAALLRVNHRMDQRSIWARKLLEEKGFNLAVVALANKMARTIWVIMTSDTSYDPNYEPSQTA